MALLRSLLLAKIEANYNEDPTPVTTTDVITVHGEPSIEPVIKDVSREVSLPHFGKIQQPRVGEAIKISFKAEFKASGAAGTPPPIGCLLRACAFTQAISAGVSVTYTPHSSQTTESVTLYFYVDGIRHKATGCVGNVKLDLKNNEVMSADFEFTGMFADAHAADVAWPSSITHSSVPPAIFRSANFLFNAISDFRCESFSFDMGNAIAKHSDFNAGTGIYRYFVADREPKGSFNPEIVALTAFNPWTLASAGTANTMSIKPTADAGYKIELAFDGVVLDTPKYSSREQLRTYDIGFQCKPTIAAGNTELIITFK